MVGGREVRRRLHAHVRVEHEPCDRDRARHVGRAGLGRVGQPDRRLGAEGLHDDLLDVAVGAVEVADREERVDALGERLADADEESGREGDLELARLAQHPQAPRRLLVRRPLMHLAAAAEPR